MPKAAKQAADYIMPLYVNGLEGRMLRLPPINKKREILFLYGSHSSLERWWGLAQELNKLGAVTMPDFPGLGGMTPLYKIGKQATIDDLADYLASFFKLKYRNKKITVVGMSLGFVVVTRMLQKYPELTKRVELLVSVVGFVHGRDLIFSRTRLLIYKAFSRIFARKWPAIFFRYTVLQSFFIRFGYHHTHNAKEKFAEISGDEFQRSMDMEVKLWHTNDVRTQFKTYLEIFSLDNTKKHVDLPVYHVAAKNDRFFDNVKVEEHMRQVFSSFELFYTAAPNHAPTIIDDPKQAAPYMPDKLRRKINNF
jgi:pimeloyl-ACP methyl ester carboxylesterase